MLNDAEIVANIRALSGISSSEGPDDNHVAAGVRGFVAAFDYWYIRVVREAVPQYRNLIIKRINPFIRRIELEALSTTDAASKLVEDWNSRNFVTAGGWALEELAVESSPDAQKSGAEGIDMQRHEGSTGEYHLYVVKSGLVTRNSDIINSLKRNARQAEKLLRQGRGTVRVHANYVITAGKTSSTFEDGVRRPSSAEFWGEVLNLPEDKAIDLALAMAAAAGSLVRRDASEHITAMKVLVGSYIDDRESPGKVDWEFIARRNMRPAPTWQKEDRQRHADALQLLNETGYQLPRRSSRRAVQVAETRAEVEDALLDEPEPNE